MCGRFVRAEFVARGEKPRNEWGFKCECGHEWDDTACERHAFGEIQGHEIVGIDLEGLVEFTQAFFRPSSIRARELRGEVLFDAVFLDRLQQASDGDQMSLPEGRKLAQ